MCKIFSILLWSLHWYLQAINCQVFTLRMSHDSRCLVSVRPHRKFCVRPWLCPSVPFWVLSWCPKLGQTFLYNIINEKYKKFTKMHDVNFFFFFIIWCKFYTLPKVLLFFAYKAKNVSGSLASQIEISDEKEHFSMTGYLSYSAIFNFRQYCS